MDVSEISEQGAQLKTLMDKVKDGTVTEADLKEMQATLSDSSDFTTVSVSSKDSKNSFFSEMSSFLDKVKNGTVSETDLSDMKSKIADMESQIGKRGGNGSQGMGGGMPPGGGAQGIGGGTPPGGAHGSGTGKPPAGGPPPGGGKGGSQGGSAIQGSSLNSTTESSDSSSTTEEMDTNGDGTVSIDEYLDYYTKENASSTTLAPSATSKTESDEEDSDSIRSKIVLGDS
jgi:hypothetical protein